jgi:hypothetical protein
MVTQTSVPSHLLSEELSGSVGTARREHVVSVGLVASEKSS